MFVIHNLILEKEPEIQVIYQDENLIAINKPHGLLVHRSRLARDVNIFALQLVRDHINQKVYPVHRLDRKTSGVLLFAKNKESNILTQSLFRERKVEKKYTAIVRGWTKESGHIDYALTENDKTQTAQTTYTLVRKYELPFPSGDNLTSRYSQINLQPLTGRYHQLRKHMKHIFHPILGDRPHGCNKQNKIWKERFQMNTMMLHASSLQLKYPSGESIHIEADHSLEFERVLQILDKDSIF